MHPLVLGSLNPGRAGADPTCGPTGRAGAVRRARHRGRAGADRGAQAGAVRRAAPGRAGAVRRARPPGPSWTRRRWLPARRAPPGRAGSCPTCARHRGRAGAVQRAPPGPSWRHPPGAVRRARAGAVRRALSSGTEQLQLGPSAARPGAQLGPVLLASKRPARPGCRAADSSSSPPESAAHSRASEARSSGVSRRRLSGGSHTPGRCRACLSAPTRPGARTACPARPGGQDGSHSRAQPGKRCAPLERRRSRALQIARVETRAYVSWRHGSSRTARI